MKNHPLIPEYREVCVRGAADRYEDVVLSIEQRLTPPWSNATHRESDSELGGVDRRLFERAAIGPRPAVLLLLMLRDSGDISIPNIVPLEVGQISMDEYNATIEEFVSELLRPAADELGLEIEITGDVVDLADELDPVAFEALRHFSAAANKSSGASHPIDQDRWMRFICSAFRSNPSLSHRHLERWLVADGWSEEQAFDLLLEFDFAMRLLAYDRRE